MDSPEYAAEANELITRVISTAACLGVQHEGRVEGFEERAISEAVQQVWKQKGPQGQITDVYNELVKVSKNLEASDDRRISDVVTSLRPFTAGQLYGQYFEGPANISIDGAFTVVELSDVKGQPVLEQVILQIIMFLGTELMFKTGREERVVILLDEAWDFLKGDGTAKFIEGVVRRARKYNGALITGTQSIDDYFANPAAQVCWDNSDWRVIMSQKPDTIDRLTENKRLHLPPGFGTRLKTITTVPGEFSELAISGQDGWAFAALMLDDFSLAAYSSKGPVVVELERRRSSGMNVVDALKSIVADGLVS